MIGNLICSFRKSSYCEELLGEYQSYDLVISENNSICKIIKDVSADLDWVKDFVEKMNSHDVSVEALQDLLYDLMP